MRFLTQESKRNIRNEVAMEAEMKLKVKQSSLFADFSRRMVKGWSSKLGFILFVFIVLACLIGPLLSPYRVNEIFLDQINASPSAAHWFGCDSMGRDLLTRILYGGRYSLNLGLSAALLSALVGSTFGLVAGYFGSAVDGFIMRFMDVWSALPGMLLCILVSAFLGAGFYSTVIALTVGNIPYVARMIRGQVLSERTKEYMEAAKTINCSKLSILFTHLLPNTVQPVIITTTMAIGGTISMAASLSFIGLGIQPPTPEWGALLADGRAYIRVFPHLIMFPGIAIALTVLSLNLLGDGLRNALDPKLRD